MKILLSTLLAFGLIASCSSSKFRGSAPTSTVNSAEDSKGAPAGEEPASIPPPPPEVETANIPPPDTIGGETPIDLPAPETGDLFTGCEASSPSLPIVADVYRLPEGSSELPDFESIGPKIDTICLSQYNIENQRWDLGFPGANQLVEWFALNTRAILNVPTDGNYEFLMASDDGSVLYIDREVVIDNNGNHGFQAKQGAVNLTAGPHDLVVEWYQGPRYDLGLQLFWKRPETDDFVLVPTSAFAPE